MDIKQLKYFISIADLGSMTRASESLNIAQPALTQQIAKLEADLRARVFDRGTSPATTPWRITTIRSATWKACCMMCVMMMTPPLRGRISHTGCRDCQNTCEG